MIDFSGAFARTLLTPKNKARIAATYWFSADCIRLFRIASTVAAAAKIFAIPS
jgi:hypothetical protein